VAQAIVHSHEPPDRVRARFDAYGDRITHVHVNHLDAGAAPRLADVDVLADRVATLRALGFRGSWTIELVHGLLTDRDRPEVLVAQAAEDLGVLRAVLGG
jgi:sugar phosphate isomerase/epimerase